MRTLFALLTLVFYKVVERYLSSVSLDDGIMFIVAWLFIGELRKDIK